MGAARHPSDRGYAKIGYLHKCKINIYKLAILGGIIHWILVYFIVQYGNNLKNTVLDYDSPLSMLMASAVFIYFKDFDWKTLIERFKISTKTIINISSCSLGIYLIHNLIIILLNRFIPKIYEVLDFVSIYIISLCIIYIMKRIPIVKKIVP